jgi:acyl-CoA thioester hydrolase
MKITTRVLYKDTDRAGVVYYANYLIWFEMGRAEFMRSAGYSYDELEKQDYVMPVIESFCKYHAPAFYDELITIETAIREINKYKLTFFYRIYRQTDEKLLAEGHTIHASTDSHLKVRMLPESLINRLQHCNNSK